MPYHLIGSSSFMNEQWVQYRGKPSRPYDQSCASCVTPYAFSPEYIPRRHSRWPLPHGFMRKVNFSSSSSIVKRPGSGPTPEVEWARHVAASASTICRRSRERISPVSLFQPRSIDERQASATASSPSCSWMKVISPSIDSAIRSCRKRHSYFIPLH